jgi:hypothetical membrane protein
MSKESNGSDNTQRLLAICGIIGPVSFAIVLITLGSLEPGYSHVTQAMSTLGAPGARYPLIMNIAGLGLLGLMMVALAVGLDRGIRDGKSSKFGPGLIAVSGVAVMMLGVFHSEPGAEDPTAMGTTHGVFVRIAGFALLLAPLAISPRLKKDERWHSYVAYSLGTVVVAIVVAVLYASNVFESWKAVIERIAMAVSLIWIEVMAIKLLRLS